MLKAKGSQLDDIGADENIFRKPATNAYVELQIKAYVDVNSPTVITTDDGEFSTADGHIFKILDDVTISSADSQDEDGNSLGTVAVQAISVDEGIDNNVMAGAIVNAEQSVDGFYQVTNPQPASGGQNVETDDSFRNRILANRINKPNSTNDGVENAIRNLNSVTDARLVSNRTMQTDQYGNPPKTTHLYVVNGNDDEIAQAMLDHLPILTHTVGNRSAIATDVGGVKHTIYFDHANNVQIYLNIKITTDDTKFNSDSGTDTIKQNIIDYFSDFKMGSTVDFTKLFAPCYSVTGVKSVEISLGKDASNLTPNQNIGVDAFELPVVSSDSITINKDGE
ncbi:baseplate J/gp47 family protein (plasmid) [Apilactobacillus apisilvae]|uniref:Baseplate J/gp47 family protein n=1 Tax=Apilactobacillus apisilvae TaxID=2923364 RepID=A0ABY4PK51_9LACO|nr:baseplate J/gp47 family protein [Apilactobacillus apisilvae]UQS85794.1 baseplate J/gp47 family protein [Apilactobacillus apisilvae]